MIYFDLDISTVVLSVLGALFMMTLFLVTVYRSRLRLPVRCRQRHQTQAEDTGRQEPVSVVVYARDNSARLERLLEELLDQDYPAGFEVIVVNDCGGYSCSDIVTRLAITHSNLRMTFVPEKAHNLSHKKLAITLGLKAARTPRVLLLNAECRLASRRWLSGMMAHPDSVILGQAVIKADDGSRLPLMMRLDEADTAITWIGAAERHRPFRGNGYNIGYETETFFKNNGFSGSLNLQAGDDDLFVNKVASGDNTVVVLSSDTIVDITTSDPRRLYREQKISHAFTARHLPSHPVMSAAPVLLWLSIALGVTGSWMAYPNMTVIASSALLLLTQWIVIGRAWSHASRAVGIPVSGWKVLPALLWLPLHNLHYRLASRHNQYQHYTWQNKKVI